MLDAVRGAGPLALVGKGVEHGQFGLAGWNDVVVEAVHQNVLLPVLDAHERPDQAPSGIRHHVGHTRVRVPAERSSPELDVTDPTETKDDDGPLVVPHASGLPDARIGLQEVLILLDKFRHARACDLFAALNDELDPARQLAQGPLYRIDRGET